MSAATATARHAAALQRRVQDSQRPMLATCSYYPPDASGCRAPRSCYDCLNVQLESEPDGCLIDEHGQCVSFADNYDITLDFRVVYRNHSSNSTEEVAQPAQRSISLQFPAVNTSYCEEDDNLIGKYQLAAMDFSHGSDGCVVVALCEGPNWAYAVGGSDCGEDGPASTTRNDPYTAVTPFEAPTKEDKGTSTEDYVVFWCVVISILLTLLATLAMVITIRQYQNKQRLAEMQQRVVNIGEPVAQTPKPSKSGIRLLSLFGWESMRSDLIEKERREMQARVCEAGVHAICENRLPVVSPSHYLQLVSVQPSAPVMSPTTPSAPSLTES